MLVCAQCAAVTLDPSRATNVTVAPTKFEYTSVEEWLGDVSVRHRRHWPLAIASATSNFHSTGGAAESNGSPSLLLRSAAADKVTRRRRLQSRWHSGRAMRLFSTSPHRVCSMYTRARANRVQI